ncbi:hypothetical protein L1987_08644 [Smallanthus sonchifolius]|uniref:Uncharacterized protein n=1 Tax=Smallanthus sonchifolius TaxID=185202 RepID=A0ACB9JLS0_9ASTR|nr:hypothetical protein L1987_08644 [Smallanthus sonchifolius]
MKKTAIEMDSLLSGWLEDQKKKMNSTLDKSGDQVVFTAAFLSRVKEEVKEELYGFSTDEIVKATCLVLFAAATDTMTATLTWALALLINNPLVLKKAQQELENHVGRDRKVEESDMSNLVYLEAIIKETMRLYPDAPLSLPHESTEDCIVGGYTIPKGTRLLVNIWKIHHDPQIWTDPFEFQPERFLTSHKEIDVKGRHFELMPFGSGRRVCLGSSFSLEVVQLILASIIHGFEFQHPSNEQIDMTESSGLVNHIAIPLELLVAPRLSPHVDLVINFESSDEYSNVYGGIRANGSEDGEGFHICKEDIGYDDGKRGQVSDVATTGDNDVGFGERKSEVGCGQEDNIEGKADQVPFKDGAQMHIGG